MGVKPCSVVCVCVSHTLYTTCLWRRWPFAPFTEDPEFGSWADSLQAASLSHPNAMIESLTEATVRVKYILVMVKIPSAAKT